MKKLNSIHYTLAMASSLLAISSSFAAPTIYPKWSFFGHATVKNTTNSNVVTDDSISTKIWVMPPNSGVSSVTGIANATGNMGYCDEMVDDLAYSKDLNTEIHTLEKQSIAAKGKLDEIRTQISKARLEASQYEQLAKLQDVADLDTVITGNQTRLDTLYASLESCSKDCDKLNAEIDDIQSAMRSELKTRQTLVVQHAADMPIYNRYKAKVKALQDNLKEEQSSWQDVHDSIKKVRNEFNDRFADLGKMQGGFASIKYESNWDKNVKTLRESNPGLEFEKISTKDVTVFTALSVIADLPGANAVLAYKVPGATSINATTDGSAGAVSFTSYPENFSGTAVLSLLGACPMISPEKFNLPKNIPSIPYGVISSYSYPSMFTASVTVNYNMRKMYQKIVDSGTKGGFFSSHSYSDVTETTRFSDAFSVDWRATDPSLMPSAEVKKKMEDEMKLDIYTRMAKFAMVSSPDMNGMINASKAPTDGALVLSSSLMNTCPESIYCVAGAAVLDVLDAIFGSSSTEKSYTQFQDVNQQDNWTTSQVVYQPWITTYQ